MSELERDYTYLWAPCPGGYHNPAMRIQSPHYALELDAEQAPGIARLGRLEGASPDPADEEALFAALPAVKTELAVVTEDGVQNCIGSELCYTAPEWYWCAPSKYRIIECGRNVNTVDMMYLIFPDRDLIGRFEVKALSDYFVLTFDGYAKRPIAGARLVCRLHGSEPAEMMAPGCVRWGSCELFATDVRVEDGDIVLERMLDLANRFCGMSAMVRFAGHRAGADELPFRAENLRAGQGMEISYEEETGMYRVFLADERAPDFRNEAERTDYDRVRFTLRNDSGERRRVPIRFEKSGPTVSLTGVSPMLRDAETGEPLGIPVQITKDWHIHPDKNECAEWFATAPDDPRRYLEGQWLHAYAVIELAAGEEFIAAYTCAYENWGTVCAASHAQLSLVGWGGYTIWEQFAMGSHGENICFNSDGSAYCPFINDVRPIYQRAKWGGFQEYNWTGNIGGGELLVYVDGTGTRRELCAHKLDFAAQCPVLTEEVVKCVSSDRKIACEYKINGMRTDDVTRILFRVRYDFLEDVDFQRLAFFQYDSERYETNLFRRFAVGNAAGVLADEAYRPDEGMESGYPAGYPRRARLSGEDCWFFWYDLPKGAEQERYEGYLRNLCEQKNADQLTVVRSYRARLNGRDYDAPAYSIFQAYSTDHRHPAFELTVPPEVGRVERGSSVEYVIEFLTLPETPEHYYGPSAYVEAAKPRFGTTDFALQMVREGRLSVEVARGRLRSVWPVVVEAEEDEAEFTVTGGLGYVPIRIENVSSYRGVSLRRWQDGGWSPVDQSVRGNDFWQADLETRPPNVQTYTFPN